MRFYGFYAPLELHLAQVNGIDSVDFRSRRKVPLLSQDLQALKLQLPQIATLSLSEDLPSLPDLPSAFGCMYVIEGSTLGGQLISRHLREQGITPENGGAFFNSYGSNVGRMWLSFKQTVEAHVSDPAAQEQVAAAAQDTFVKMISWFQQGLGQ